MSEVQKLRIEHIFKLGGKVYAFESTTLIVLHAFGPGRLFLCLNAAIPAQFLERNALGTTNRVNEPDIAVEEGAGHHRVIVCKCV